MIWKYKTNQIFALELLEEIRQKNWKSKSTKILLIRKGVKSLVERKTSFPRIFVLFLFLNSTFLEANIWKFWKKWVKSWKKETEIHCLRYWLYDHIDKHLVNTPVKWLYFAYKLLFYFIFTMAFNKLHSKTPCFDINL
jgi:hypothetical protein